MQNARLKSSTTLIIAILTLSMVLAAVPMANALNPPLLSPTSGYVGDQVTVSGTSTAPGGLIQVYWDSIKPWDGKAGFLAESYAVGTSYQIKIVVPNATIGTHYVIVKDVEANEVNSATFTVNPKITLSPSSVLKGDTVSVVGTGFAKSTSAVVLYDVQETSVTNENVGTGDGATKIFYLQHSPVKPNSVTVYLDGSQTTQYDLDHITGIITFTTPPASGKSITADYTYYTYTSSVSASTNDVGYFKTQFNVPATASAGAYPVRGLDSKGNTASESLTVVDQVITLTPTKGYRGATVTVKGRGFTYPSLVDIRWYLTPTDYITVVDDYPVATDGTFTTTFTVPTVPDPTPPGTQYTVSAYVGTALKASKTFTVIMPPKITLNPKSGKAETPVTITGEWFTPNKLVTFTFGGNSLNTIPSPVYTDGSGAFTVSFKVPNVAAGDYTVQATDAAGLTATATFKVTVPIIEIRTGSTTYVQGDTVSIYAKSTEPLSGIDLIITDPAGRVFWSKTLAAADIETISGVYYLKWSSSLVTPLPIDAPLGSWNFTAKSGTTIIATNLFTVVARALPTETTDLLKSINASLSEQLSGLNTAITKLNTTVNQLASTLNSLSQTLSTVSSAVQTASSSAQNAVSAANAAKSAADSAASAAQNAVSAANAAKSAADSAASAAQNAVSTANAAKSAADSAASAAQNAVSAANAAKAAAEGITVPVWIAVVLSLVAAIAAIFAIITIRGKIAG